MKQIVLFLTLLIPAVGLWAKKEPVPPVSSSEGAVMIQRAMERFEEVHPDWIYTQTYDVYPDSISVSLQAIRLENVGDNPYAIEGLSNIVSVFDTIFNTSQGLTGIGVRMLPSDTNQFYDIFNFYSAKKQEEEEPNPYDNSSESSSWGEYDQTFKVAYVPYDKEISHQWVSKLSELVPADLSPLQREFELMCSAKGANVETCQFNNNVTISGALRLRGDMNGNSPTRATIASVKCGAEPWINLHHIFMRYFGAPSEISLTYTRNNRSVYLIDYLSHTVYAATYVKQSSTLYMLKADYERVPFLPLDWRKGESNPIGHYVVTP